MPSVPLNSDTATFLAEGLLGTVFNSELAKLADDIERRGDDGKERILAIEFRFKKKNGFIFCEPIVAGKVPKQGTFLTKMQLQQDGREMKFFFNPKSMDEPGQLTVDDALPAKKKRSADGEE